MYAEQIEAGVEWLDKTFLQGWCNLINLNSLNMDCYTSCILGQLTKCASMFHVSEMRKFGFFLPLNADEDDYLILTKEWKEKILQLRALRNA